MSKILAILLVVAMLVTVFVGCAKKNDGTESTGGDASSKTSSLASDWYKDFSITIETGNPSSTTNSTGAVTNNSSSTATTTPSTPDNTSSEAVSSTTSSTTSSKNPNDEGWSSWWTPSY